MYYVLLTLFILACVVLIVSVLLQPGKADAGSLFTSSISSAAFGPRGTQTILAKITIGAAATFFLVALLLGFGVGGGQRSLMEGGVAPQPVASPTASPAASPAEGAAPAASPAEGAAPAASPATTASPATK